MVVVNTSCDMALSASAEWWIWIIEFAIRQNNKLYQ
jgi:hypothetical protein